MKSVIRAALAVPRLYLADVQANVQEHLKQMQSAKAQGASLIVFPELSLTGATCGDLFRQDLLIRAAQKGLDQLTADMPEGLTAIVGLPMRDVGGICPAAAVITRGKCLGHAYKCCTDTEKRWFVSKEQEQYTVRTEDDVVFVLSIGSFYAETALPAPRLLICADARPAYAGERKALRKRCTALSKGRSVIYVSAGAGESSTDAVYGGYSMAAADGNVLAEQPALVTQESLIITDVPLMHDACMDGMEVQACEERVPVSPHPFYPVDPQERSDYCREVLELQAWGLARRLQSTGGRAVIGVSGGLDSTLALLASCRAMDVWGRPRADILGVTMPCFGTTDRTYRNALALMDALGVSRRDIPIQASVRQHLADIGHDESEHSIVYENAQARERTQVLMDVANQFGGIVVGTGDLSEIALGWCTYNADHMSMYGVNCGVPKSLVRQVVEEARQLYPAAERVLTDILATPVSPELLPPDEKGGIAQQTEDLVGPYVLHDFFLYYALQGNEPRRIDDLARRAFEGVYTREEIRKWLLCFYRRFLSQQFKRSCMPDGVQVLPVGLSPRGAWQMPSDAQSALWLRACDELAETPSQEQTTGGRNENEMPILQLHGEQGD